MQKENEKKTTSYELAQSVAASAEILEISGDVEKKLQSRIKEIVMENMNGKYFALMSPGIKYLTLFVKQEGTSPNAFVKHISDFCKSEAGSLGGYKGSEIADRRNSIEIWFGNEVYMFFNYDGAVEEV